MQGDQTVEIIDYCPLDLFSCDESRLRKSLPQLIKLAGNKFKLFIQGEKIDIGQVFSSTIDIFNLVLFQLIYLTHGRMDGTQNSTNSFKLLTTL